MMKVFKWALGTSILIVIGFYCLLVFPERCQIHIAKTLVSLTDVKVITEHVERYSSIEGRLPIRIKELEPEYLKNVPANPWGYEYRLRVTDNLDFNVYSLGSDNAEGGEGTALDIYKNTSSKAVIESIKKPIIGCNA